MYQQTIRECVARLGRIGVDPRHVEADTPPWERGHAADNRLEQPTGTAGARSDPKNRGAEGPQDRL